MKRVLYYAVALACAFMMLSGGAYSQTPPPPTNLTAHVTTQVPVGVELSWKQIEPPPPVPLTVFKVYRSIDDSTSFAFLNVTNSMEYNDRQVSRGHTYYYYVTAVWILADSSIHESAKSNTAWAQVPVLTVGPTGEIVGTVTDSVTGKPIAFSRVIFYRTWKLTSSNAIIWVPQAWTDSAGHYSAVLDTGTYLINCRPPILFLGGVIETLVPIPLYLPKWYKDAYDPAHATPVAVTDGGTDTIDFALARFVPPHLVHIRGTVDDSLGNPLKGARVAILRTLQEMPLIESADPQAADMPGESITIDGLGCLRGTVWTGLTDSTGAFDAQVLSGRSYIALATDRGYFPQYYDHQSSPETATIIHLSGDTSNINFNLNPYRPPQMYSISGVVRDSAGVRVPSRIIVFPIHPWLSRGDIRFGFTDSLGAYTVGKLLAGNYFVLAVPTGDYAPAFYKAGAYGVLHWKDADTVKVSANVTGIDIGVVQIQGGGMSTVHGSITSAGAPMQGVNVYAQDASGIVVGFGVTDDQGAYTISSVPAGSISITADELGYTSAQNTLNVQPTDFALAQDFTISLPTAVKAAPSAAPLSYRLEQNYPNPFNPSTRISYSIPQGGYVSLRVFNLLGQTVATLVDGLVGAGLHDVVWDGRDAGGRIVASGVYFYRVEVRGGGGGVDFSSMRKMILLK